MFVRNIVGALVALFVVSTAQAQVVNPGVQQQGSVTAGNCASWYATLRIKDAGAPCAVVPGGVVIANRFYAGPTSGAAAAPTFRAIVGQDLPAPALASFGGIFAVNATSNMFVTGLDTAGNLIKAQPSFSNLSGTISVSQFPSPFVGIYYVNAVCDGVTNVQAAIQAQITAAELAGGGRVVMPAGTCIIGSQLTFPDLGGGTTRVSLQGAGYDATRLKPSGSFADAQMINLLGNNNVLSDFQLDGNSVSGLIGVLMGPGTNVAAQLTEFLRLKIQNLAVGLYLEGGFYNVEGVNFVTNVKDIYCFAPTGSQGCSNGVIIGNHAYKSDTFLEIAGQSDGGRPQGVQVIANVTLNNVYGVLSRSTQSLHIIGNTFDRWPGTSFTAVSLQAPGNGNDNTDVKIIGNWLAGTAPFYASDWMHDVVFEGNRTEVGTSFLPVKFDCTVNTRCSNIQIVSNNIRANDGSYALVLNNLLNVRSAFNGLSAAILETGGSNVFGVGDMISSGTCSRATMRSIMNSGGTSCGNNAVWADIFGTGTFSAATVLSDYTPTTSLTPVLAIGGSSTGITYSAQTGSFVKVGKLVTFSFRLTLTSKGAGSGNATVTASGLPGANGFVSISCGYWNAMTSITTMGGYIDGAGAVTLSNAAATNRPAITDANLNNTSDFICGGSYPTP